MAGAISIGVALQARTQSFDDALNKSSLAVDTLNKKYAGLEKNTAQPLRGQDFSKKLPPETLLERFDPSQQKAQQKLLNAHTSNISNKIAPARPASGLASPARANGSHGAVAVDTLDKKYTGLKKITAEPLRSEDFTKGILSPESMLETFHPSQKAAQQKLLDAHTSNIGNKIKPSAQPVAPAVQPVAPAAPVDSGLASAAGAIGSLGAVAGGVVTAITAVATAATAAAAAIGSLAVSSATAAVDSLKMSRTLGVSVDALRTLEMGVKNLGGDATSVTPALTAMARTIQGSIASNFAAAQSLQQLGLAGADLVKLTPDKQFTAVAESIASISDPAQRAASAFGIFGSQAGDLLPLLSQGKAGIDAARESVDGLASNIGNVDATNLETIGIEVDKAWQMVKGLGLEVAKGLIPYLQAAIDYIQSFGATGKKAGEFISSAIDKTAYSFFVINDILLVIKAGLYAVAAGFAYMVKGIASSIAYLLEVAGKLPDKLGGKMFRGAAESVRDFAKAAGETGDKFAADAEKAYGDADTRITGPEKIKALRAAAAETARLAEEARSAGGAVSKLNLNMEQLEMGKQLKNNLITPLQAFRAELEKLQSALDLKLISTDQYALGVAKATNALEDAHKLQNMQLPGAAARDTTESYSIIAKSEQQDKYARESPADRALRIQEQALVLEQQQLEYAKRIADALGAKPKVAVIK